MLTAPSPLHPAPALAAVPVNALLAHFATALPWLTHCYGLVQTGTDKAGKELYPQLYRQQGDRQVQDVRPDERAAGVAWFEYDAPDLLEFTDLANGNGTASFQLALVGWANLQKIDPLRPYDFTDLLAQDALRALLSCPGYTGRLVPERIERQAERVFERYRWEPARHQLIFGGTFGAFRIPFTVDVDFTRCVAPFVPLSA